MKKLLYALCFILLTCAFALSEEEEETVVTFSDGIFSYMHVDGGISIIQANTGAAKTFTIPSYVDGYPVKDVQLHALTENEALVHLILSEGIESITVGYIYPHCENLAYITLPSTITKLDPYSYDSIGNITFLPGPNGARYEHKDGVLFDNQEKTLLYYPDHLTQSEYVLPDDTLKIAKYAFSSSNLTSVMLNDGLKEIGQNAFSNVTHLKTINIPASVESIGISAFRTDTAIDISVSGDRFQIFDQCLYDMISHTLMFCLNGEGTITLHPDTETIAPYAFHGCSKLERIETDSDRLTEIGEAAFSYCDLLSYFRIPESVKRIGARAFYSCDSLLSVIIPDGIKEIPLGAFSFCEKLTTVILGEGIEIIGTEAFYSCANLISVKAPETLRRIEEKAYCDCLLLVSVFLPENIEFIGPSAFENCRLLGTLVIGEALTEISANAFRRCESLTRLLLNDKLEVIGEGAFALCHQLDLRANGDQPYFSVLDGALYDKRTKTLIHYCPNKRVTQFTIPEGVKNIGPSAFEGNTTLEYVSLPESLESIGEKAFIHSISLKEVVFSGAVNEIREYTFYGCQSLENIVLPNGISEIGSYAFDHNKSLKSLIIPSSVKKIGSFAFGFCTSLECVIIEEGCEQLGFSVFRECASLRRLQLPSTITIIDSPLNKYSLDTASFDPTLIVEKDSYALQYARDNGYNYIYPDSYDWLTE